jgi:hypothetical protein
VVEAIVAHGNPAMTWHYTHVTEFAAAHAVNGLPAVIGDLASPGLRQAGTSAPALPPADLPAVALGHRNWQSGVAETEVEVAR